MTEATEPKASLSEVPRVALEPGEALHIALQLHRKGALEDAELLYRRILETLPDSPDTLHFLGLLHHQQGRHGEAAVLIERIIALDPGNADAHNNLGNVLAGMERRAEAEACYRKAIQLYPGHANAHNNLGVVCFAQMRVKEAVEAYHRATELAPGSADYRYNLGNALRKTGALDEAARAYREAVAVDAGHDRSWQGLARTYLMSGRREQAAEVYEEWLRLNPGDPAIIYSLNACRGENAPSRAPDGYIQQVFDNMAENFDSHLESLDYCAPNLVSEAVASALSAPAASLNILDAGCGTGLCGPLLRPYARKLTGVDLSSGMLNRAEGRKVYDELFRSELTAFMVQRRDEFDVITSADTLCYFGDLGAVFSAGCRALKPGGIFCFTLEDSGDGKTGSLLSPNCRYSHSRAYVEEELANAGLQADSLAKVFLRNEGGEPVAGHLVVAKRQAGM